jgi:hypothetical protein
MHCPVASRGGLNLERAQQIQSKTASGRFSFPSDGFALNEFSSSTATCEMAADNLLRHHAGLRAQFWQLSVLPEGENKISIARVPRRGAWPDI